MLGGAWFLVFIPLLDQLDVSVSIPTRWALLLLVPAVILVVQLARRPSLRERPGATLLGVGALSYLALSNAGVVGLHPWPTVIAVGLATALGRAARALLRSIRASANDRDRAGPDATQPSREHPAPCAQLPRAACPPPSRKRFAMLEGPEHAVLLRPLRAGDETELLRIHATAEVSRWWGDPAPGFPWSDEPDATRLVIEVHGMVAGMIQFTEEPEPRYRHATIDLFLDPSLRGRGLGTAALSRLAQHLIDDRGHHRITIDPAATNTAAIRSYEKAGFRPVGVMRQYERDPGSDHWHDGLLMELLAGETPDLVSLGCGVGLERGVVRQPSRRGP